MLNMIRMDIYRLFRTKSMYVIWFIMALLFIMSTYMTKVDLKEVQKQAEEMGLQGTSADNPEELEDTNIIGINVIIPTRDGEKVTVYDEIYANAQGRVMALFVAIFTVLFSTADLTSGYIKNIGGQVKHRGGMILSRSLAILVNVVLTLGLSVLFQALCNRVFLGYCKWGDWKQFGTYFLIQAVLHFAFGMICMAVAVLLRNNVISMIFAVCLCLNVTAVLYGLLDKLILKAGVKDFAVAEYTVTGRMSMLPLELAWKDGIAPFVISAVFVVVALLCSSIVFEKRDVV